MHWNVTMWPYGSEFSYDTTGQEEVVVWLRHYAEAGDGYEAAKALRQASTAFKAYVPVVRALASLAEKGDAGAIAAVSARLEDSDWGVRRAANRRARHATQRQLAPHGASLSAPDGACVDEQSCRAARELPIHLAARHLQ